MTMVLIDEVSKSGLISPKPPKYYELRAISMMTQLQTELLLAEQEPQFITSFDEELIIPAKIAITVLPYGLAAHLLLADDINTASFFNARYDELKRKTVAVIKPIEDKLGILGGMN